MTEPSNWHLPHLVGVGPIRSGTTWLHAMLFGHRQVATTRIKEVNYFNLNHSKGLDWYREHTFPRTSPLA